MAVSSRRLVWASSHGTCATGRPVMRTIVPNDALNLLRKIGDIDLDSAGVSPDAKALQKVRDVGLSVDAKQERRRTSPPIDLEVDKLAEAQRLFATYQTEIAGALLLVAFRSRMHRFGPACSEPMPSSTATSCDAFGGPLSSSPS